MKRQTIFCGPPVGEWKLEEEYLEKTTCAACGTLCWVGPNTKLALAGPAGTGCLFVCFRCGDGISSMGETPGSTPAERVAAYKLWKAGKR